MEQNESKQFPLKIIVYYDENQKQTGFSCKSNDNVCLSYFKNKMNLYRPWRCISCGISIEKERFKEMYHGRFCYKCVIYLDYKESLIYPGR